MQSEGDSTGELNCWCEEGSEVGRTGARRITTDFVPRLSREVEAGYDDVRFPMEGRDVVVIDGLVQSPRGSRVSCSLSLSNVQYSTVQ